MEEVEKEIFFSAFCRKKKKLITNLKDKRKAEKQNNSNPLIWFDNFFLFFDVKKKFPLGKKFFSFFSFY